jgi:hypothetical protein
MRTPSLVWYRSLVVRSVLVYLKASVFSNAVAVVVGTAESTLECMHSVLLAVVVIVAQPPDGPPSCTRILDV